MKGLEVIGSYLDEWNIVTITVRLILAVVCGGAIGLTRSVKRRGAGFKTHALVCLGSALVMIGGAGYQRCWFSWGWNDHGHKR